MIRHRILPPYTLMGLARALRMMDKARLNPSTTQFDVVQPAKPRPDRAIRWAKQIAELIYPANLHYPVGGSPL